MIMQLVVGYALVIIVSYLLGSIPCGVILGKICFKGDPRSGGSGSIGATNMNRMFGWKAFAATFVFDALKGALAVIFARVIAGFVPFDAVWEFDLLIVLSILLAILGHVFSPWLGFKGGKGISTGFGSILAGYPIVAISILITFLIFALFSKRVSVGSIAAAIGFPVFSWIFHYGNIPLMVVSIVAAIAVVFAHRGNVKRIIEGTEPKFSFNKGKSEQEAQS